MSRRTHLNGFYAVHSPKVEADVRKALRVDRLYDYGYLGACIATDKPVFTPDLEQP